MGIDTSGGKFCFPEQKETDTKTEMTVLSTLKGTSTCPSMTIFSTKSSA